MTERETELLAAVRNFLAINQKSTRLAVELSQHGYRNTSIEMAKRVFEGVTTTHLALYAALKAYDEPQGTESHAIDSISARMSVPGDV